MKALKIYKHILSVMRILIFEINNKAIPIYKREFIIWLRLIYDCTQFVLTLEIVYSTVEYNVHTISKELYTPYTCVHTLEHCTFIDYSHNKNNSNKVRPALVITNITCILINNICRYVILVETRILMAIRSTWPRFIYVDVSDVTIPYHQQLHKLK